MDGDKAEAQLPLFRYRNFKDVRLSACFMNHIYPWNELLKNRGDSLVNQPVEIDIHYLDNFVETYEIPRSTLKYLIEKISDGSKDFEMEGKVFLKNEISSITIDHSTALQFPHLEEEEK